MKQGLSSFTLRAPWETAGLPKESAVLLALSGGMDSSVLLHLLAAQSRRDGFPLFTAHLHHGIRGEEADRDADFCRHLAQDIGCPFFLKHVDVPALAAESGKSLEAAARETRYAFFEELMREHRIPILVTAHHADDHLETVLFRLARGTGLRGLCGISEVRAFAKGYLVRPLLPFSRWEIETYCRQEGLNYVQDSTNRDPTYARNRIRMDVIPALEQATGDPQRSALRMSRSLEQDEDYLSREASALLQEHRASNGFPAEVLAGAHPAIRRRILAMLAPCALEAVHIEAIEALLKAGRSGSRTPLPNRHVACLQQGMLSVLPDIREEELPDQIPFEEGVREICDGKLRICVTKIENLTDRPIVHNLSTHVCIILDGNALEKTDRLYWRRRKAGDCLLKDGAHRKIADLSREKGIPPMLRDVLFILCDGEEPLWVPFVGARDGAVAKEDSQKLYRIECSVLNGTD